MSNVYPITFGAFTIGWILGAIYMRNLYKAALDKLFSDETFKQGLGEKLRKEGKS